MRPPASRPNRRLLHLAMQMQAPLDRLTPIAAAISTNTDAEPQLDLHRAESKDTNPKNQ